MKIHRQFIESPARGVVANAHLNNLRETLFEWCGVHERYCRLLPGDAIYWYNERTNLSALAVAAWKTGFVGLEEYTMDKSHQKQVFRGRGDLWIVADNWECFFETNLHWLSARRMPKNSDIAIECLNEACADARKIPVENSTQHRIGIAFIIPCTYDIVEVQDHFDQLFSQFDACSIDAISWCFPHSNKKHLPRFSGSKTGACPGVILLARKI